LFRRSIAFDDCFAQAHTGLATALLNASGSRIGTEQGIRGDAKSAALRAIHLDAAAGDAYAVLGTLKHRIDRDWLSAEKRFAEALALSPASPVCHLAVGRALSARGRHREAVNHMLRARELDPLDIESRVALAQAMCYGRFHAEAVTQLTSVLEIVPHYALAEISLGFASCIRTSHARRQAFSRAAALLPANPSRGSAPPRRGRSKADVGTHAALVARVLERPAATTIPRYTSRSHTPTSPRSRRSAVATLRTVGQ